MRNRLGDAAGRAAPAIFLMGWATGGLSGAGEGAVAVGVRESAQAVGVAPGAARPIVLGLGGDPVGRRDRQVGRPLRHGGDAVGVGVDDRTARGEDVVDRPVISSEADRMVNHWNGPSCVPGKFAEPTVDPGLAVLQEELGLRCGLGSNTSHPHAPRAGNTTRRSCRFNQNGSGHPFRTSLHRTAVCGPAGTVVWGLGRGNPPQLPDSAALAVHGSATTDSVRGSYNNTMCV